MTRRAIGVPPSGGRQSQTRRRERKTRFLVVSEGTKTEPQYFERARRYLEEEFAIQVIHQPKLKDGKPRTSSHRSDPVSVVEECIRNRDLDRDRDASARGDILPFARCFAVVDVDQWDEGRDPTNLKQAIKLANKESIELLISNVKFETWLVWHDSKATPKQNSEDLSRQAELLGYLDKKTLTAKFPVQDYQRACKRADSHSRTRACSKGSNPSTAIPRLFDALQEEAAK